MKKYFIAYSNLDLPLAKYVHAFFSDLFQGNAEFFLSDSIDPGEVWYDTIREAVNGADAGLFLLTPMSVNRQWLNIEFGGHWVPRKKVFPLVAGGLEIRDIPYPFSNYQATRLSDVSSVSRLIRRIASLCEMPVPPIYNAASFCEGVRKSTAASVALPDIAAVSGTIGLGYVPRPETLNESMLDTEPSGLSVKILANNTLCASGSFSDSGIVNIRFPSMEEPVEFLALEVCQSENICSSVENKMAKIVANQEPIPAFLKQQRHPFDSQFIPKQNGYFVFSLVGVPTDKDFYIRIVLWRMQVQNIFFRLYFFRQLPLAKSSELAL